jgi:HK97 gp10 family phage protein
MKADVTLIGVDRLMAHLKKNATLDDVRQVVKTNGAEMHTQAQRFAPVRTGNLKRNIRIYNEQYGLEARINSEADYAAYVEWGTRYMAAQPHVGPAFKIQSAKFKNDMGRLVK